MLLETNKIVLGQKIKAQRKRKRITQFRLAELIGLHEKQVSRIEAGLNYPTYLSFVKIVDALEMDISDFNVEKQIEKNPAKDDILHIISTANEIELKTYLEILKPLRKNLKLAQCLTA
jgi:transcriptional regulator with XRE-family HTH domain